MSAWQLIFRRIAAGGALLIGVSTLSFCLSAFVPGDYLDEMRLNPQVSSATLAQLRSQYGLDRTLPERYICWLGSLARGDLGFSFAYNMPVSSLLWSRCRNTILLAGTATMIAWLVALPLGIAAAARGGWLDRVASVGNSGLLSIPEIAIILFLLMAAVRTGCLPAGGMVSSEYLNAWLRAQDVAKHMIIPVLALALVALPIVFHHTRTAIIEVLQSSFIQAALGHGIGFRRVLLRHALPAAANPMITLLALSFAGVVGTSLLAEVVTGWPGLGPLFVQSIFSRDFYVVIGIVLLSSSFLVIGNLLGDLLLYVVDPRIRAN